MNKQETITSLPRLTVAMDMLIYRHGAMRVLAALAGGVFRVRAVKTELEHMPDYLRMDIGLVPRDREPRFGEHMR